MSILYQIKNYYYLYLYFFIKYGSIKRLVNVFLNLYEYKTKKIRINSTPFIVHFDVANACTLHCPLCPTGKGEGGQNKSIISFQNFKAVFDQIKDKLMFIRLYNWGEPFLCKDIFKIVDYCHENKVGVQLHTNLNYYNDEMLYNIVSSKIDYLHVSIDGMTQKEYEYYRVGGDVKKALQGLEKIVSLKKKMRSKYPIIHWGYLINNANNNGVKQALKYARKIGIDIFEAYPLSIFNSLDCLYSQNYYIKFLSKIMRKENCKSRVINSHCRYLWCNLAINPNKTFAPCCIIYKDADSFGSIDNKRISDIINSTIYIESRKLQTIKNYTPSVKTPCIRCQWFSPF